MMIRGLNPSNDLKPILVDSTGRILLSDDSEILRVSPPYGNHAFTFYESYIEAPQNESLGAGTNIYTGTAVPSGEVWVVTNIMVNYEGTVTGVTLNARIQHGSTAAGLFSVNTPVSTIFYDRQGWWPMSEGDYFSVRVGNATAGDKSYSKVFGFKYKIA